MLLTEFTTAPRMFYSSFARAAHAYPDAGMGAYVIDDFGNSVQVKAGPIMTYLRQEH